jgi:23S rRNA (cytidine1920-2'-O)/16S rRNA (cytidine1409-2'-O)-methyltransferase
MKKEKRRLDTLVLEHYPHLTRNQVQSFIMQAKVCVDGVVVTKAGAQFTSDVPITLDEQHPKFVSRAGFKLESALDAFGIDPTGLVCMDAGISTGGFTDCLLQRGAKRVYGIDVGYGQVHEKVAQDERVILLEKTNLRLLTSLPEVIDLATLDLSFISLLKVIETVKGLLSPTGKIITLIKPQFEAERKDIGRGGLVSNPTVHEEVIQNIKSGFEEHGFELLSVIQSPILGAASGNIEFVALFKRF